MESNISLKLLLDDIHQQLLGKGHSIGEWLHKNMCMESSEPDIDFCLNHSIIYEHMLTQLTAVC